MLAKQRAMRNKAKAAPDWTRYRLTQGPLSLCGANCNLVRVGALTKVQSEKLPWDKAIATELIPVKAKSRKAPDQRLNRLISWKSHPLPLTPIWMAKGYLHLTSRIIATTASHGGDPGWPPIKGSAVKHDRECQRDSRNHSLCCDPTRVTVYGVLGL